MRRRGNDIPELRQALLSQNDRVLRKEAGRTISQVREVTIMGDKDIPYRLLKKVMATCTGRLRTDIAGRIAEELGQAGRVGQLSAGSIGRIDQGLRLGVTDWTFLLQRVSACHGR